MKWLIVICLGIFLVSCASHDRRAYRSDTPEPRKPQKPYVVNGERYDPLQKHDGFTQEGMASWYGADFHGKRTSNGETFDMYALTAAHKTLPLGVYVKTHNKRNGKEVVVRINDRGPFVRERIIDLSFAAAKQLGVTETGTAPVRIEALGFRGTGDAGAVSYRPPSNYDTGTFAIQVASFTEKQNATRLSDTVKKRYGYSSIQDAQVNNTRFFRVRAGRYESLKKAEAARSTYERDGYQGCFVVAMD